jgi:hypothetical protein
MPRQSTLVDEGVALLDAMDLLLHEARNGLERRGEIRVPFLRGVTIATADTPSEGLAALCRDLSPMGIGLVHSVPLEPQDALITIQLENGESLRLWARIKWCQGIGSQWYVSGAQFLRVALPDDSVPCI